jgi:hypothetical protein
MKDTGTVISKALANLNNGKDVQIDKVLRLRKTEVMDLVLEEILSLLEARKDATEKLIESLKATIKREAAAYVREFTGLTTATQANVHEDYPYKHDKDVTNVGFYLPSITLPSGRSVEFGPTIEGAYCQIPLTPALKVRWNELKSAQEELSKVRLKLHDIEHSKTKFKATVIKSMLLEHKEGRSLLDGIRDLAERLV